MVDLRTLCIDVSCSPAPSLITPHKKLYIFTSKISNLTLLVSLVIMLFALKTKRLIGWFLSADYIFAYVLSFHC